tara:strand:+ start:8009 stop:8530 length:522 start_codon:yes stop_codon:yes gene_type:complete
MAYLMKWLFSLLSINKIPQVEESAGLTMRMGKCVPVDEVFKAWTSGDLSKMLGALNSKTNLIDRHFLLQSIVTATYKLRKNSSKREICIKISEVHIQEFSKIAPALQKDMGGQLPRISTFQQYATVLTEDGNYEKAISVCEKALEYGVHDGTKSGFEGRIARIRKKVVQDINK